MSVYDEQEAIRKQERRARRREEVVRLTAAALGAMISGDDRNSTHPDLPNRYKNLVDRATQIAVACQKAIDDQEGDGY